MSANFQINARKSNGNLYVQPAGDFDGSSAWMLVNLLHEKYEGRGRIFINTNSLGKIYPFGCSIFKNRIDLSRLPADRLFFKGKKGFKIAPNGTRVILVPEKQLRKCSGNCAGCRCSGNKKHKLKK